MKNMAFVCIAAMLFLTACGPAPASSGSSSAAENSSSQSQDSSAAITPDQGAALLEEKLGSVDSSTGNQMSYGYEDTLTLDGIEYYRYRVSWLVNNDHLSYLTDYLVSTDGKEIKEYVPEESNPSNTDLRSAADALLKSMKARDFTSVAAWVDPEQGVTFTPYSYVNFDHDLTLTADEVAGIAADTTIRHWGVYDGSGEPIDLTTADYWDKFVWNADYTAAPDVTICGVAQQGNVPENVDTAYPQGSDAASGYSYVEYHYSGFDAQYGGMDWCSLKVVFRQSDGAWKLVGIIHSQATI